LCTLQTDSHSPPRSLGEGLDGTKLHKSEETDVTENKMYNN